MKKNNKEVIHFDYETFSEIDLMKCGMFRYAEDTSTEVICLSYAIGEEEPLLWTPYNDEPSRLFKALKKGHPYAGHNVSFEIQIWMQVCTELYGWPKLNPDVAIDTAAMAAMHSIPRSLDGCCKALGVDNLKDKRGKHLINKLCKPRKPSKKNLATRWTPETAPEDFEDFYEYCRQDVRAERDVHKALDELPPNEYKLWQLDRVVNQRGVYVDQDALNGAIEIIETVNEQLNKDASRLSAGAFNTTNQREKVLEWCRVKGYAMESYTADFVKAAVKDPDCPPQVKEVLDIRRKTSRTSIKKFYAMQRAVCIDGTIKGTLLYHGAGTGRWAGRLIQPQNFPRPTLKEVDITLALILMRERGYEELGFLFNGDQGDTMVSCIRGTMIPKPGNIFYCGDFANVEGRVLLWCANDERGMDLFRNKLDLYIDMATEIYSLEYEMIYIEYKGGDDSKRRMGKLAILGLGYAMGAPKFVATAATKGVEITMQFAKKVVKAYREKFKPTVKWWKALEQAAGKAMNHKGKRFRAGPVSFIKEGIFLKMRLPSGRSIYYPYPEIREMKAPWGGFKLTLTYMVEEKKQWVRTKTFGGKLAENAVQGIARDLLVEAMFRLEEADYKTTLTIHDESLSEVPIGEGSEKEFKELMEILPDWAEGMPIEAEVWTGMRYKK